MIITAAQMASYIYSEDQDPAGAFEWWLNPCGGTDLVPEEIIIIILLAPGDLSRP